MKLIVPHNGEVHAADARLMGLAEFLGIKSEPLRLDKQVQQFSEHIETTSPDSKSCLVINPQVMREWIGGDILPPELVSSLVSHYAHVLVHAMTLGPFVDRLITSLSDSKLQSVQPIADAGQPYEITSTWKDFVGPFSGLSFGPVNTVNDRVLAVSTNDSTVRNLICIGGRPLMTVMKRDKAEILFLASEDTADINAQVGYAPLSDYFSRIMPHAMALRHIFGDACWHPCEQHASIIIDDPLLRRDYGYLNFDNLLNLMEKYNFHTTIAFIPHNYQRNSARIVRMFRENPKRFGICFHGNDHTQSEFVSNDRTLLNTMLCFAEDRINKLERRTGLRCDKVMVFPQGDFSVEAMKVLKSRNFHAAVNTVPHPMGHPVPLTIGDLAQPGVLRYGGFPLFLRRYVKETQSQDIAFNLFFGRPALIVEHHDIFKNPESLVEIVQKINSVAPGISWSSLESAVDRSILRRRAANGTVQVRAYSSNVHITNDSASIERFSIAWGRAGQCSPVEQVLRDGTPFSSAKLDDTGVCTVGELVPGSSQTFSVVYRNGHATLRNLGFSWNAKAVLRRRFSEVRDNYLSKNQHVLRLAKTLQRRLLN